MTDKHAEACRKYYLANQEVKRLTREISACFHGCIIEKELNISKDVGMRVHVMGDIFIPRIPTKTCLEKWFKFIMSADNQNEFGGFDVHPSELPDFDCEHCNKAFQLIQDRKKSRAELGSAKRSISLLGRKQAADNGELP